ncbi:MAG: class I SAM-dependent methyltransferase [Thermoplasmatales archaeon]
MERNYYDQIDSIFSKAAPVYDQKIQANFINIAIRNKEIEAVLRRYRAGWRLLEIGCGTGEEASKIIRKTGCSILCIDVSSGMLRYAGNKMNELGIGGKFFTARMPASLIGGIRGKFGIVYSFNGALNNEPNIRSFFRDLDNVIEDGGYFIASVRNRYSLAEVVLAILSGKGRRLLERIGGDVDVEVVGNRVSSHYFTDSEFLRFLPDTFYLEERVGLGIFVLPSLFEKFSNTGWDNLIKKLESTFSRVPPLNYLGDETLFVFRKRVLD